jgi:hypothetical protein
MAAGNMSLWEMACQIPSRRYSSERVGFTSPISALAFTVIVEGFVGMGKDPDENGTVRREKGLQQESDAGA